MSENLNEIEISSPKLRKSYRREKVCRENSEGREYHGREEMQMFFSKLQWFLKDNIGRHVDDIYADWCGKFPAKILRDIDTRWYFRWNTESGYGNFCVDENGILRKQEFEHKKHENKIQTGEISTGKKWVINKKALGLIGCRKMLVEFLGENTVSVLENSETVPDALVDELLKIEKKMVKMIKWEKTGDEFNPYLASVNNWFIKFKDITVPVYAYKGSDEYSKIKAEGKTSAKAWRKAKKQEQEDRNSNMLVNETNIRKGKIRNIND